MFLFQLLCLQGEWDKASTHLRALASLSGEAQMLAVVYGQLIETERVREAAFAGKGPTPALVATSPWVLDLVASMESFARGDAAEGEARREAAFDAAGDTPGVADGVDFDWIADADPRFGPACEMVVTGSWGVVPFEAIQSIKSDGPKDLRDLVWLPATVSLRSGQSTTAYLPARYPGTSAEGEANLRLARATDWRPHPAGDVGVGQRLWSLSGGEELGLLSFRSLQFH